MLKSILVVMLLFVFGFAVAQNCQTLPRSFISYQQATSLILKTKFSYTDKLNTFSSSWIRSATFKSCDTKTGFLIIGTDTRLYIHQNVPLRLWQSFKRASSFGSFYTKNLRKKYLISIQ